MPDGSGPQHSRLAGRPSTPAERVIVALNGSSEAQPMPDVAARGKTLFVSDDGGAQAGTIPALGVRVLRMR